MKDHINEIKKKLAIVIRHENLFHLIDGLYKFFNAVISTWFLFVLFEFVFKFNSVVRTYLFISFLLITGASFIVFVIPSVLKYFKKHNYHKAAEQVGEYYSEIKDELLNAFQLVEDVDNKYSTALVDAAFKRVYGKARNLNFKKVITFNHLNKRLVASLTAFIFLFMVIMLVPALRGASSRLLNFSADYTTTPQTLFDVQPGNISVTKGENVKIEVGISGILPNAILLYSKSNEDIEFSQKRITVDSLAMFSYEFRNVRSSLDYYVSTGNAKSETFRLNVIDRPVINKLEVTIIPASYSNLPISFQQDNGNITTLTGSKIKFNIAATKPLRDAQVIFSDSTKTKFSITTSNATKDFTASKDLEYYISVTDQAGNTNANPIVYSITTIADEFPSIELLSPEKDVMLTNSNTVPIHIKIADDFGFTKLNLNYRLSASKYEDPWKEYRTQAITINTKLLEDDVYYNWDLSQMVLAEGDAVTYHLEIFDNDNVNGPKSTKTPSQTVRVPSLDDLFGEIDKTQTDAKTDLEKMLDNATELKDEFEKLSNELKQDSKAISWEEKEKIKKAVQKFEEMNSSVEEIQKQLSQLQQDAVQNNLLSEETMEKYLELQKLMDQLGSSELMEAFKKMQEMLQQLSRNQVQQSFEDLKANEEFFQKSIERTINLLKRIQVEQKVDELIKRTDDISNKLNEALEKTKSGDLSDIKTSDELNKRQKDIGENVDKMNDVMSDLQKLMNEIDDMPADEMNKLMNEFQKQQNDKLSQNASGKLRANDKSSAMQCQQQMMQNMQTMTQMLKDMQQSIQQMNQMQALYDMLKITDNLITLSKEEENLINATEQLTPASKDFDDAPKKQNELIANLDKVTEMIANLAQKTFAITPEMGKAIGNARWQMQQSITLLQNRNTGTAPALQRNAMQYLNEAALLMKSAMDMMMKGGQGGGMMSMMQQLQQMSQQQMNLNQLTKMLNLGTLSQQQMAQLQRLANEQAMIRKSLDQLNRESKESGQSKKLAANLDKVLQEMQEVIQKMNSRSIDDNLILKQERILSRLLDAQRSMNERDFEDNRESQSGTNISRQSPGEIDLSTQEARDKLRDELIRAMKEGYKKDYENLIRKYFEALEKEQINN